MKMENYPEYIDAYFNHELTPAEARQFEQKIIEDRNFAEEVAFYLSAKYALKEQVIREKKEWFRQILFQNSSFSTASPDKKTIVRKFWVYAAAAAVVIFILFTGYLFFFKQTSPQQMAKEYVKQHFQSLGVRMGNDLDSIQKALRLYNEGKLVSSLVLLEKIIHTDTANVIPKKYAGIVSLRLENYDKALDYFEQLEKHRELHSNPALLYKALTLMKRDQPGDKQQAHQLLRQVVQMDLEGKETAQQWLEKW